MSKLEVKEITPISGETDLTLGQSGGTVTLATGATAVGFGSPAYTSDAGAPDGSLHVDTSGHLTIATPIESHSAIAGTLSTGTNALSLLETISAPRAGQWIFTISASTTGSVGTQIQAKTGSGVTILSDSSDPSYGSLFATGLYVLDGQTDVLFYGARQSGTGGVAELRNMQLSMHRLG